MPTIAEIMAAKAARAAAIAAKQQPSGADPLSGGGSTLGKPSAPVGRISPGQGASTTPEPRPNLPYAEPGPRSLGANTGEMIDVTPTGADPATVEWHRLLMAEECRLVVTNDPDPRQESAWLALLPPGSVRGIPALLCRLPFVLHPQTQQAADDEPF